MNHSSEIKLRAQGQRVRARLLHRGNPPPIESGKDRPPIHTQRANEKVIITDNKAVSYPGVRADQDIGGNRCEAK